MLSHSVLFGNNQSEVQFIGDLANLCKLHKIHCGDPKDLAHLGKDLQSNENFRMDLFALCTAISHMSETDLSAEKLLYLVVCAFGGSKTSLRDATIDLPQDAMAAFLDGYETWSKRDPDLEEKPRPVDPESDLPPLHPVRSRFYDAATRAETNPEPTVDRPHTHSTNGASSHHHIPGNTPLEELTLSELRMYLEDIENRVNRIEPRLERIVPQRLTTAEPVEPVERVERVEPKTLPVSPEPEELPSAELPASEPVVTAATIALPTHSESELVITSSLLTTPQKAVVSESIPSVSEAAHLRRLRMINAVLAFLLIVICGSVAIFAWRYLRSQPSQIATQPIPKSASANDSASKPTATNSDANVIQHDHPSPPVSHAPAPVHLPDNTASADPRNNHLPTSQVPRTAAPIPLAPVDTIKAESPPVQIPEAPASSYVNKPITFAPVPDPPDHSPASAPHSSSLADAHPPVATPPSRPVNTPAPSPVVQSAKPANLIVSVPPAMIMTYAVSTPKPTYPLYRHLAMDTTIDVEATISKDGKIINARALNGALDVQNSVVKAVQTWRFRPYILNGDPVVVSTTFKFVFKAP